MTKDIEKDLIKYRSLSIFDKVDFLASKYDPYDEKYIKEFIFSLTIEEAEEIENLLSNPKELSNAISQEYEHLSSEFISSLNYYISSMKNEKLGSSKHTLNFIKEIVNTLYVSYDHRDVSRLKQKFTHLLPSSLKLVDIVATQYIDRNKRRNDHVIITLENDRGVHSFCYNNSTRTLIYGFNADKLDFISLKGVDAIAYGMSDIISALLDI